MICELCKGDMKSFFDKKNSEFDEKYPKEITGLAEEIRSWADAGKEIDVDTNNSGHYPILGTNKEVPIEKALSNWMVGGSTSGHVYYGFFDKILNLCYWCISAVKFFGVKEPIDPYHLPAGMPFWLYYNSSRSKKPKGITKFPHNLEKYIMSKKQLINPPDRIKAEKNYILIDKRYFFKNKKIIKEDINELYEMLYENKYMLFELTIKEKADKKAQLAKHRADKKAQQAKHRAGQKKQAEKEKKRINKLRNSIIKLLKEKAVKMPASDIDAFLKHQDVDEIKELCEQMYHNGEISRTANYRYFILSEEKKEPKKASEAKSEAVDVEKELEKLKGLLDKGLITQEAYDAKMNQLLGL